MKINEIHTKFLECDSVSIDTRIIQNNSLFVAIKGDKFDANTFANDALLKGAKYVIIDNKKYYIDKRTILVDDSLSTLQELSKFHRKYLGLPIISLTGSNGKTTTKELINGVLSKKFKTKATKGNLNNHIGVPLTLLSFTKDTEIGIVEMGANHQKEIEFLCEIAQPDYGYITNFGKAHLEGFGGVEGVIKGKSELYSFLEKNNKTVFVNFDDLLQENKTKNINRLTFSNNDDNAFVFIENINADPFVTLDFNNIKIKSNLIGLYNVNNINAAITIGKYFGVEDVLIKNAIESYIPDNNRSQLIKIGTNEIILDAYNANPSSMNVAIDNFIQFRKNNKTIILGDMFELGEDRIKEHNAIVSQLQNNIDINSIFIGKNFSECKIEKSNFNFFSTFDDFLNHLKLNPIDNNLILIKGSRGMALERTLDFL